MKRLGWDELRSLLSGYACSESGAKACLDLWPESDFPSAQAALNVSAEMAVLLAAEPPVPACSFKDILPLLDKASKEFLLEPKELKEVAQFLRLSETMVRYFGKCPPERISHLTPLTESLLEIPGLAKDIDRIVTKEGEMRPNASPELAGLKRKAQNLRSTITTKMEKVLDSFQYSPHLQDRYCTEREQRYVIPIKSESRSKCRGIVHGISGSGATLFLEPEALVDLNNQLKIVEMEIEQEVLRILRTITREVALAEEVVRSNFEILTQLDVIQAKARFGESLEASFVELAETGSIDLKNAKHPVLLMEKREAVVGNTLEVEEDVYGILISGPNTGGKTVTLKMLGLMALMAASGLPLPVAPGSRIPFFPEVYADIGDEQDLHRDLSTFSAHMVNIIRIMESAKPHSLVLLDELIVSTEPEEGAALAEAVLLQFIEKKIKMVVTTHYDSLKALGQTRPDFLNIGFGFDLEKMAPTYRLTLGTPQKSSPMEIALRLGMDRKITEMAAELLKQKDRRLDHWLSQIQEERSLLESETAKAKALSREIEEKAVEKRRLVEEVRQEKEIFHKEKKKRLSKEISAAKREIREIVDELKSKPGKNLIRKVGSRLDSMGRSEPDFLPSAPAIPLESLKPGDLVEIPSLHAKGELLDAPLNRKKVRVKIGNFESTVNTGLIRGLQRKAVNDDSKKQGPAIQLDETVQPSDTNECDLRGMSGDEAASVLARFLDAAVLARIPSVRIIHGMGTGAVRKRVLELLEEWPFPHQLRPGYSHEGGYGVTVVELKA